MNICMESFLTCAKKTKNKKRLHAKIIVAFMKCAHPPVLLSALCILHTVCILSAYCSASISLYKETHLPLGEAEEVVMML